MERIHCEGMQFVCTWEAESGHGWSAKYIYILYNSCGSVYKNPRRSGGVKIDGEDHGGAPEEVGSTSSEGSSSTVEESHVLAHWLRRTWRAKQDFPKESAVIVHVFNSRRISCVYTRFIKAALRLCAGLSA
ncbi:hypothetical protein Mapa_004125 [Marchantia paleacea]|nr:hypothetical protein Mapa_004125 [Marchantia paleacea]